MEYPDALSAMGRIKRAELREGQAVRGWSAEGSYLFKAPREPTYALVPPRAHLDVDAEIAAVGRRTDRLLESDRLSMLRSLAGTKAEHPRTPPASLRDLQREREHLEQLRDARNAARAAAWQAAEAADTVADATGAEELDPTDGRRMAAFVQEQVQREARREALWQQALVASASVSEPGQVRRQEDDPVPRVRF